MPPKTWNDIAWNCIDSLICTILASIVARNFAKKLKLKSLKGRFDGTYAPLFNYCLFPTEKIAYSINQQINNLYNLHFFVSISLENYWNKSSTKSRGLVCLFPLQNTNSIKCYFNYSNQLIVNHFNRTLFIIWIEKNLNRTHAFSF